MYLYQDITDKIIKCALRVHTFLGPGLNEELYKQALYEELLFNQIKTTKEVEFKVTYREKLLPATYRADLIVENLIILELKSVEALIPIHKAQVFNYLRLSNLKLGLLMNFNTLKLKDGLMRVINTVTNSSLAHSVHLGSLSD